MREAQFLKQNADKWKDFEASIRAHQDAGLLAERFIELTDDLAYSRTFYPDSQTTRYLNGLASLFHQKIYRNKKERSGRVWHFWQYELPFLFYQYRKQFAWALVFFLAFCFIGALSAHYDDSFIRLILGNAYVDMTNENIAKGNPFGVYQSMPPTTMFVAIAFNNILVAIVTFALGVFCSVGTIIKLFQTGLMLGSFEYYFFKHGLGFKSITVVFIHGTLEIWAIVIAGAAGLILGNSILFPKTYPRAVSFVRGAKDGLKIVLGLVPVFIVAAFFEGYVTRYANMPLVFSLSILGGSLLFIVWYFVIYPARLHKRIQQQLYAAEKIENQNFNKWLNKKLNSERSGTLVKA